MKEQRIKNIVISIHILLTFSYIIWRLLFTMNPEQPIASIIFLIADIFTGISSFGFAISLWNKTPLLSKNLEEKNLSVDVWIPTINEDIEILEKTILHCVQMLYPHNTYVLDDGNRKEVKILAERLGAYYISRYNNENAKAGNLNNALKETDGDLIAIFDADFIPRKNFITKLIGYFNDDNIAIVQTPQYYYNNSFQHRRLFKSKIYSDQDTFLHVVLPSRSNWNSAYWIGTNALIRRKAIKSIKGFPLESVTEDILTSILIHAKGWNSIYVDEPLAFGYAPINISQYFVQRTRWAKGAIQIFFRNNPLFKKGLTSKQKILYFSSLFHFIEGTTRMIYYIFPALFFIATVIPIKFSPYIIVIMILYFIINHILIKLMTSGRTNYFYDEVYAVIRTFIYLLGLTALFVKNVQFKVTPKNKYSNLDIIHFIGPLTIFTINLTVVLSFFLNPNIILSRDVFVMVCFGWCLYILVISAFACQSCLFVNKTKNQDDLEQFMVLSSFKNLNNQN